MMSNNYFFFFLQSTMCTFECWKWVHDIASLVIWTVISIAAGLCFDGETASQIVSASSLTHISANPDVAVVSIVEAALIM